MGEPELPEWAAPTKEPSAHRTLCITFKERVEHYKVGDQKYYLIGRAGDGATILLQHEHTSRRHALITQNSKGQYYLMDLGSRSGTWMGKKKLPPNQPYIWDMQSNAKVRFGDRKQDASFDMAQLVLQPRAAEQQVGATSRAHPDAALLVGHPSGADKVGGSVCVTGQSSQVSQGHESDRLGFNRGGSNEGTERKRCLEPSILNGANGGDSEAESGNKRYKASNGMHRTGEVQDGKVSNGAATVETKAPDESREVRPMYGPELPPPPAPPQEQQTSKQEQQPLPEFGPEPPPPGYRAPSSRSSSGAVLGEKDPNGFHRFEPQKAKQSSQEDTWTSGNNGRLSNGASVSHGATGSNGRLSNGTASSNGHLSTGSAGHNGRFSNGSIGHNDHLSSRSTGSQSRLSNGSAGNNGSAGSQSRLSNGSAGNNGSSAGKQIRCDKCDKPHPTDQCPYFKGGRDKHKDAWVNYGRKHPLEMGTSGGNFVLKRARHIRQPGDGSCLFHSLSFGLKAIGINGYENSATSLRRNIANFIHRNASLEIAGDTIEEWVKWDSESTVRSYASRMSVSGWGGGIEMAACARLKGVNIHVYQNKRGEYHRISCFDAPNAGRHTKTIHVLYVGGMHYDALAV